MKAGLARVTCAAMVLLLHGCGGLIKREEQPISPHQVVQWSKQDQSPQDIIEKLKRSDSVYMLTASQLVQLAREGVAEQVLDHMQRTQLIAIEREARRTGGVRSAVAFVPAF